MTPRCKLLKWFLNFFHSWELDKTRIYTEVPSLAAYAPEGSTKPILVAIHHLSSVWLYWFKTRCGRDWHSHGGAWYFCPKVLKCVLQIDGYKLHRSGNCVHHRNRACFLCGECYPFPLLHTQDFRLRWHQDAMVKKVLKSNSLGSESCLSC